MIQDLGTKHLINHYEYNEPSKDDYIMFFKERMIYLKDIDEKVEFLTYSVLKDICEKQNIDIPEYTYLFKIDDAKYFLIDEIPGDIDGFDYIKMYDLRRRSPKEAVFAGATAYHLYAWYNSNRYCGACGAKMIHDTRERMVRCPECGNMVFPKLVPAVIVGLTDGDRILLTRYSGREYKKYALIAGFTEIGETMEETVAREVMEETGLKVKNISYYKSQPWGFDSDLLLGFFCELDGDDSIRLDEDELEIAEWVNYKDMPRYNEGLSLTEEMMNYFCSEREKFHKK